MSKKRIITFVIATLLASAVFYVVAARYSENEESPSAEVPAAKNSSQCIQCAYLPEGAQQDACLEEYGCR